MYTTQYTPSIDPQNKGAWTQGAGASADGHRCQNRGEGWQGGEEVSWLRKTWR